MEQEKELHGFFSEFGKENGIVISPRLYADQKEKICITFFPVKPTKSSLEWEDWNCYRSILRIHWDDYQKLVSVYFDRIFPLKDPVSGEIQETFDPCFDNWIGKAEFEQWIKYIEEDLPQKRQQEQKFLKQIIEWVTCALEHTDVIMIEGNL